MSPRQEEPRNKEKAMSYVDGFVLPIPKSKAAAYRKQAKLAAKLWIDSRGAAVVASKLG